MKAGIYKRFQGFLWVCPVQARARLSGGMTSFFGCSLYRKEKENGYQSVRHRMYKM